MEFEVSPLGGGYVGLEQLFEYLGPAWGEVIYKGKEVYSTGPDVREIRSSAATTI